MCVFTDDKAFYTEEKIQKELQNHLDVTDGMQEKEYPVTASVGMAVKENHKRLCNRRSDQNSGQTDVSK